MRKILSSITTALMIFSCAAMNICYAQGNINTADELNRALEYANDGETIVLSSDLNANEDIIIDKSVTLNLNGHTIHGSVVVGSVITREVEDESKYEPGHYVEKIVDAPVTRAGRFTSTGPGFFDFTYEPSYTMKWVPVVKKTWVDGKYVTNKRTIYIDKDINVVIENGTIIGKDGRDGKVVGAGYGGNRGDHALIMKSGSLKLKNITAYGGDGGNGADGDRALKKRKGGNGGHGNAAIEILEYGKRCVAEDCEFYGGKGGKAGKGDGRGWTSIFSCHKDGVNGMDHYGISYDSSKSVVKLINCICDARN